MKRATIDKQTERKSRAARLVRARDAAKFRGPKTAAKKFGWNPETYKAHESGRNGFDLPDARKYADAFGVNVSWLYLDQGPMFPDESRRVVAVGEEFDPDPDPERQPTLGRETGVRGIPAGTSPQIDVTGGMGAGGLTIVTDGVPGAGGMTFAAEHIADFWRLPLAIVAAMGGARPQDIAIIPVQGDSMSGTLTEGDFVFIDTRHRAPSPDGIYALADEFGGIVVKRLEMASGPKDEEPLVRIISDNPRHRPKELPLDHIQIIGRVLRKFGVVD